MYKKTFQLLLLLLLSGCGANQRLVGGGEPSTPPTPGIVFVTTRHAERDPTSLEVNWELYLVQPDGSGLTRLTDNEVVDASPDWSPDGRQIVFRSRLDGSSDLFIMDADGSHVRNLIKDPADSFDDEFIPRWNPQRDLIAMYTDRFIADDSGCALHRLAYMPLAGGKDSITLLEVHPGNQETLDWSADGSQIVFSSRCDFAREGSVELYAWEIDTEEVTKLTDGGYINSSPALAHNGRYLAYFSTRAGDPPGGDIYVMDLETGEERNITNHAGRDGQPSWSPDDTQIAFVTDRDGNDEIYVMNADGSNPVNISNHPAQDREPSWSPIAPTP